tara:strand:+ start:3979 stop:4248 length:270 start_codon:yes stop_codon:yes gene_type:complete
MNYYRVKDSHTFRLPWAKGSVEGGDVVELATDSPVKSERQQAQATLRGQSHKVVLLAGKPDEAPPAQTSKKKTSKKKASYSTRVARPDA